VWGADFGVVTILRNGDERVEKGVLAQAKRSSIPDLQGREKEAFLTACEKMSRATTAVLGVEIPQRLGDPVIVREVQISWPSRAISFDDAPWHPPTVIGAPQDLSDYLVGRLLSCNHGDTAPTAVRSIGDSKLSHLVVIAESSTVSSLK
jgi:hypothetical protein